MDDVYDLVVIGAGPAGQVAAELASSFGRRVLIVERNKPGGVVTTTGGAPTKALREAALYLTGFRQEEVYGIRAAAPLDVVLPTIRTRVERVRDVLQGVVATRLAERGIAYLQGTARLGADHTVRVTSPDGVEHELAPRAVLVATGSRPTHYPGIPFDDPDVYDSDQIYSIRTVPKDIVIVGGGPVGVEFATVFTALGIPATLVSQSDRLLPAIDCELAGLVADEFERRGVGLVLGASADGVKRTDGRLSVTLSTNTVLAADAVLFAAGRTSNTEGLGLEEAGVQLDARGRIVVDRYHRTTAAGVYAAGDVVDPALASTAMQHGRAAASHACGLVFGVAVDQSPSTAVYSLPEVAGVGATEEQVQGAGITYAVGRCDLATTARGVIAGHGGLLKLIFRADDRKLLGVHCFGDIASEVVGLGHLVLHVGGSVEVFLTLALNTPTYIYAYHDATVDGLTRLAELMEVELTATPRPRVNRDDRQKQEQHMSNEMKFADRIVMVSGAASGIGKAAALEFARQGALVVGADLDESGGQALAAQIQQGGGKAEFVRTNVSREDDIAALIRGIGERHGRLDVAFNNAGISGEPMPLVKCTLQNWDRVVGINLTGVFLALHYELELMLAQGKGAIVNTTSLAGLTGPARAGAYSASKWGVIGLTRVAANEHARFGIRVNAVAPGFTLTAMVDRDEAMMPGWKQSQIEETPMHRGADPVEIARAVVWLASDDASFITGQTLAIDGGVTAGGPALTENPLNYMST